MLERIYAVLISQANQAYIESNKPKIMSAGLSSYFLGKAEAYEHSADELRAIWISKSIWIQPQKTMREQDCEAETQQVIRNDVQNDF